MDNNAFKNGNYPYSFDSFDKTEKDRNNIIQEAIRFKHDLDNWVPDGHHLVIHVGGYLFSAIKTREGKLPKQCQRTFGYKTQIIHGTMKPPIHLIGEMNLDIMIVLPDSKTYLSDEEINSYATKLYRRYHGTDVNISIIGIYRCCFPTLKQICSVSSYLNKILATNTYRNGHPYVTQVSYNHCEVTRNLEHKESLHGKKYYRSKSFGSYELKQIYTYGTVPSDEDFKFTDSIRERIIEIANNREGKLTILNDAVLDIYKLYKECDHVSGSLFFAVMPDIFYSLAQIDNPGLTLIETGYSGYCFLRYRYWSLEDKKVHWYNDDVADCKAIKSYCFYDHTT